MNNGMGFWIWLFLGLVLLGICGIGPCADGCRGCGPRLSTIQK